MSQIHLMKGMMSQSQNLIHIQCLNQISNSQNPILNQCQIRTQSDSDPDSEIIMLIEFKTVNKNLNKQRPLKFN